MSPFTRWLLLTIAAVIVGTGLFLVTWDIPAPTARVQQTIPDERFRD
jgi:hypothetical protein